MYTIIIYGEILVRLSESFGEYPGVYNLLGLWKAEILDLWETEEFGLVEVRRSWTCGKP